MPADDNPLRVFSQGPGNETLTSDRDYPKILKDMMKHIHLEGDAVYKGYPFMQKGVELWYVEVHLHHLKGVFPKMMGQYFFHFTCATSNFLRCCSWSSHGSHTPDRRNTWSKTLLYSGIPKRSACRDDGNEAQGHHDETEDWRFQGACRTIPVGLKTPRER